MGPACALGLRVILLGYCAFALVDAWTFQRRENLDLDRMLRDRARKLEYARRRANGLIGRMEIPRLGLSRSSSRNWQNRSPRGVGHPGTALPGEAGNVGFPARDTFFRPLKDLRTKDEIRFSTLKGDFRYEVESLRVVEPSDVGCSLRQARTC